MIEKMKEPARRLISRVIEADSISVSTAFLHQRTFSNLKGICCGKNVVVCGAGPSLQKYRPIENAVHIAVNRAFMYDRVDFDYIFSQDYEGIYMVQEELVKYRPNKCVKLLGSQYGMPKKEIPESLIIRSGARRFVTDSYIYGDGFKSKFVRDIDLRPIGNMANVGLSVMQLALFMNPDKIFIVGCDMSGGHFANHNMTEKEIASLNMRMDKVWKENRQKLLQKWIELKEFANRYYPDTEIVSVNPIGLKGVFKDVYQEEMAE